MKVKSEIQIVGGRLNGMKEIFIFWSFLLRQEQCWGKVISMISKGTSGDTAVGVKVLFLQEFNLFRQNWMKKNQSNILFYFYEAISQ